MKICRKCNRIAKDDSLIRCLRCSSQLEDIAEDDLLHQDATSVHQGIPLPSQSDVSEQANCPICSAPVTPGMPFCINGHLANQTMPTLGEIPRPGALASEEVGKIIPWLTIAGVEVPCRAGDVLGRLGTLRPDLFHPYPTVSGCHCALHLIDDRWMIQRLHTGKNPTFIDGQPIEPGSLLPLTGIHVLQMSSRCTVQISLKPA